MKITEFPQFRNKDKVLTLEETTSVQKAAEEMKKKKYGSTLVTKKGELVGIFTERDVLYKVVASKKDVTKLKLKDVMTKKPVTATMDDEAIDILKKMSDGRFRHMPIIDEEGDILGMLSQGDFVALDINSTYENLKLQAKSLFVTNTQIFVMFIGILIYITAALIFIS